MGFDAQGFREQRVIDATQKNQMGNAVLYVLIGVSILVVLALYILDAKNNDASIMSAPAVPVLLTEAPSVPSVQTATAVKAPITIQGEIEKYHHTMAVLSDCGSHFSYERKFYRESNYPKYLKLAELRRKAPRRKLEGGNTIVPDSMMKSWKRLDKIDNTGDVVKFLAKGGAIKHQMAAMEMMSNMENFQTNIKADKARKKVEKAADRTKKACSRLQRDVQRGKLNLKVPKL